ncbi:hypothetical protein TNCV_2069141 [Trichonephila clavipes]|uniref:Uncharacterized protein n=1 Tax=Trichonephila clavipes TaxID=2585209 RepID=A0A8X6W367_TRICX|nr:hypothetical protein TNCV_2069141 [Trichonephila clavipes]
MGVVATRRSSGRVVACSYCCGSINEYQACLRTETLRVSLQTDHLIGTSDAPQLPMVTYTGMGTKLLHESNKISVPLEASPPPVHEWYEGNHPGAALLGTRSRGDGTTLARFRSGHLELNGMWWDLPFLSELQCYPSRSPHILACIGCHKSQLLSSPATVLQCSKTHGFMNLI